MSTPTNEEHKKNQIKTAQEFLNRFIKALQTGESFMVNGVFNDNEEPHAVFLAGGYPKEDMVETLKVNSRLIIDHLEGKQSVEDGVKKVNASRVKIEPREDGGVDIKFNNNNNEEDKINKR